MVACFGYFLFCFASMVFIFLFCLFLVGVGLGRGHLMIVCTLVGQAPCFSTGSILTKWEVHCCCFEAQHQDLRGLTSHGQLPKSSWGSVGVSTCTPMGLNPEPVLNPEPLRVPKWTRPMSHHSWETLLTLFLVLEYFLNLGWHVVYGVCHTHYLYGLMN